MLIETFLRGFVIIRADAEDTINTSEITRLEFFDDSSRVVTATTHQDGHAPLYAIDNEILDFQFLFCRQRGSLTRRGKNTEEVCAIIQLIVKKTKDGLIIYSAVFFEGGDESDSQALENILYHIVYF